MTLTENITYDRNGYPEENSLFQYKIPARNDIGHIHVEFENFTATIYPCAEVRSSFLSCKRKFPYDKQQAISRRVIQLLSENSCGASCFAPAAAFQGKVLKASPFAIIQVIWADFAQIQVDLSKTLPPLR